MMNFAGHVVKHYLTSANGFWVDLIAAIPWDALVKIFEPRLALRPATYRIIRMVRLLRMLRAPRLITRLTVRFLLKNLDFLF